MKKLIFVLLAVCLMVILAGCGGPEPGPEASTSVTTTSTSSGSSTFEPEASSAPTASSMPSTILPTTIVLPTVKPEDNVNLTTQTKTYPVGMEKITATWHNGAGEDMIYGESFHLQAWDGGKWSEMEPISKLLFLRAAILKPGESGEITYEIGYYYGPLQTGRYRVATYYFFDSERPVREITHEVFIEFEVK